ncbi:hypothetical protein P9112_002363 [Eukaryota sp. TZLM1-RC]
MSYDCTQKICSYTSIEELVNDLKQNSDDHSIKLFRIATQIHQGNVVTLSDARRILSIPSPLPEAEAIEKLTQLLPVHVFKKSGLRDYIIVPKHVPELLNTVACLHRKMCSLDTSSINKRGAYRCSVCSHFGHTKSKCPVRFSNDILLSHDNSSTPISLSRRSSYGDLPFSVPAESVVSRKRVRID